MSIWVRLVALLPLVFSGTAFAQQAPILRTAATQAKDLAFPMEPSPLPQSAPQMAVHKPESGTVSGDCFAPPVQRFGLPRICQPIYAQLGKRTP
jgi:hypothetical protein